jgi:mannosyl-3-phosphoglycerate phosphatase
LNSKDGKTVIFTDLDGTILDEKYDWQKVKPIISQLIALNVAVVLCSSKTRAEIEFYRKEMGITDPFIIENGAAILIPTNYFSLKYAYTKRTARYRVIELGIPYSIVRKTLEKVRTQTDSNVIGFGDLSAEEIAKNSGLTLQLAKLAKKREYDEPFRIVTGNEKELLGDVKKEGLSYTKGNRYFHLLGNSDKGKAAASLKDLYAQEFGKITAIGLGDSPNDLPMLKIMDKQLFVKKTMGRTASFIEWKKILHHVLTAEQTKLCE